MVVGAALGMIKGAFVAAAEDGAAVIMTMAGSDILLVVELACVAMDLGC